ELLRTGVHQDLTGCVVHGIRLHGANETEFVHDAARVREQLADFDAAASVPGEFVLRTEQGGVWIDERGSVSAQQLRRRQPAVVAGQLRLRIEQLQMAGSAGMKQINDVLGLGREVRTGTRRRGPLLRQQRSGGDGGKAGPAFAEKPAAREGSRPGGFEFLRNSSHITILRNQGRHNVSSKFSITRLTIVHAAMSFGVASTGRSSSL